MLKQIIEPAIANLQQSEILLTDLDSIVGVNESAAPYGSSVGGHLRHVFDVYQCILDGIGSKLVDLIQSDPMYLAQYVLHQGRSPPSWPAAVAETLIITLS